MAFMRISILGLLMIFGGGSWLASHDVWSMPVPGVASVLWVLIGISFQVIANIVKQ